MAWILVGQATEAQIHSSSTRASQHTQYGLNPCMLLTQVCPECLSAAVWSEQRLQGSARKVQTKVENPKNLLSQDFCLDKEDLSRRI